MKKQFKTKTLAMDIDLEKIVEKYGKMVASISHRMIQDRDLAKEAAQEVWYDIVKSIGSFKGDSELSTWIYTIAKRTILRYSKNEKTATILELEEFRALPEVVYNGPDDEMDEWVKQICDWCLTALNHCLNNDSRLIFIFRENVGLSYKEIGEIMEMKEDNIRQISSRSVRKISNFLNDTCPLYNPEGKCKCRIKKQVAHIELDKEYAKTRKIIRLADLYQRFEKDFPGKNYWEKLLN